VARRRRRGGRRRGEKRRGRGFGKAEAYGETNETKNKKKLKTKELKG